MSGSPHKESIKPTTSIPPINSLSRISNFMKTRWFSSNCICCLLYQRLNFFDGYPGALHIRRPFFRHISIMMHTYTSNKINNYNIKPSKCLTYRAFLRYCRTPVQCRNRSMCRGKAPPGHSSWANRWQRGRCVWCPHRALT